MRELIAPFGAEGYRQTPAAGASAAVSSFVLSAFLAGCVNKDDLTVWKTQLSSPDGSWTATADTIQNGGFGSAHIDTSVYLQQVGQSWPPTRVLGFNCQGAVPRPYVLDNVANAGGTIHLTMRWITPSHLHVTYDGHPTLDVAMARFYGITITTEDLSDKLVR